MEEFVTREEAARRAGWSAGQIDILVYEGRLKVHQTNVHLVSVESLNRYLQSTKPIESEDRKVLA